MNTLIVTGLTFAGKKLLINLISEIYESAANAAELSEYVQITLEKLDLEADLKVIRALVESINVDEIDSQDSQIIIENDIIIHHHHYNKKHKHHKKHRYYDHKNRSGDYEWLQEAPNTESILDSKDDEDHLNNPNNEKIENNFDPIAICLDNVNEMLIMIQNELKYIMNEIYIHKTRFFYWWRKPNIENNIEQLIRNKRILDKRVNLLFKLISIRK